MSAYASESIKIPEGIEVSVEGMLVTVSGPKGKISRDFAHSRLKLSKRGGEILLESPSKGKRLNATVGTIASHIRNMFKGVTEGHVYNMRVIYAHFPITVKVAGKDVLIENFMGERSKRVAKIVGNVKVTVQGDELILEGIDKEEVGQTAANIHMATHVKKMDPRVFQDGVYLAERR
ncbi:MAG: 50S ribosomal protein L6 [Candidatus Verstraetearchaeota archaeon]|nr:50S ribosomal protein L6 [Candidatus Verstraetearchaeota archaeon]